MDLKRNLIRSLLIEYFVLCVISLGSVGVVLVAFGNEPKSVIPLSLTIFCLVLIVFLIAKMRRFNRVQQKLKTRNPNTPTINDVWVVSWIVILMTGALCYWANPRLINYFSNNYSTFKIATYAIFIVGLILSLYLNFAYKKIIKRRK